jgi:hypothetical protein
MMNKAFANIVPKVVLHWVQVDFTSIQDPHLGYKQQDHINPHCMEMASVAMIYFGLGAGNCARFLLGKYTGQHQDVHCTLDTV